MERWPALTGMRGIAALAVVLFHIQVEYEAGPGGLGGPDVLRFGWAGVDFFFVLSAFLLGGNLLRDRRLHPERARPVRFLAMRFLRIAPPYYVSVALAILVGPFLGTAPDGRSLALHALYLQNMDYATMLSINPIFWTLAVEAQFYLLLPWLARVFESRRWPWALAALVALSLAWRAATYAWALRAEGAFQERVAGWSFFTLPAFLAHFALGLAAARLFTSRRPLRHPVPVALAGVLVLGAALAVGVPGDGPAGPFSQAFDTLASHVLVRPVVALGFAAVVLAGVTPGSWVGRVLVTGPFEELGAVSYSLYLVHGPLLVATRAWPALVAGPFLPFLLAALGLTLLGAGLFYLAVEETSMRVRAAVAVRVLGSAGRVSTP